MKILQPLAVITPGIDPFLEWKRKKEYEGRKIGKGSGEAHEGNSKMQAACLASGTPVTVRWTLAKIGTLSALAAPTPAICISH